VKRIKQFVASAVALVGAVISGAFTANGFRPLSKRGYSSLYAFGYGVVASELPLQMLAYHVTMGRGLNPDAPRALAKVTETR